ncbi:hypothetical protein H5P28_09785 [Ruficoccus amylovorans]|uniref:O-antigen ligase domain-containing protein n=1 Tax=Ruficoccus amylovorans TaxID=1804625 RepID=A0A842HET0_9BACT|nr:hypothetical protein [Ruficoccus amylovorans]MBC2594548.1 hypothetical protein [Ruficoccus amylovorans]
MAKGIGTKGLIKLLLWAYIALLLGEGALRKWFLVPLSEPLLIVRDPIVVLIYLLAFRANLFPVNGFVIASIFMGFMAFLFGALSSESSVIVTLYGMRINFLQIPLIFVIGQVLDYKDCVQIGKVLIALALPQVLIMVLQFSSPQGAWINSQVGGGEGIMGALGRYRPPGTFSFITGPAAYFPLVLAFVIAFLLHEGRRYTWLCYIGAASVMLAIPISISRLLALTCALVMLAATYAFYRLPNPPKLIIRSVGAAALILVVVPMLPVFDTATETFTARWVSSTGEDVEGFKEEVVGRFLYGLVGLPFNALFEAPLTGHGIGVGSNVGAKMLTGEVTFLMGESEWQKAIMEMGPMLGLGFIVLRLMLVVFLFRYAFSALGRGNAMPLLLFTSCFTLVLNGQWGPPTILGFAILGSGLTLAATKTSSLSAEDAPKLRQPDDPAPAAHSAHR